VTGAQWRMRRQILPILEPDIGGADADLAVTLAAPTACVRQAVVIVYRKQKAGRCRGYVVLLPQAMAREVSAA
jgi:hypothetical protein